MLESIALLLGTILLATLKPSGARAGGSVAADWRLARRAVRRG